MFETQQIGIVTTMIAALHRAADVKSQVSFCYVQKYKHQDEEQETSCKQQCTAVVSTNTAAGRRGRGGAMLDVCVHQYTLTK